MKRIAFFVLSLFVTLSLLTTSCGSSDPAPAPEVAGPTIVLVAPVDSVPLVTGSPIYLTADLTSGSNLTLLTASVAYKSDLKALVEPWNPTPVEIVLEGKTTQSLKSVVLFSSIPASAKAGIYHLVIDVKDSGNKTVREEIPFLIVN